MAIEYSAGIAFAKPRLALPCLRDRLRSRIYIIMPADRIRSYRLFRKKSRYGFANSQFKKNIEKMPDIFPILGYMVNKLSVRTCPANVIDHEKIVMRV